VKTVCLLGSSSGRNAGDAALIGAIMHDMDQASQVPLRYEVPTTNPKYLKKYYTDHDVRPIPIMPWNASIRILGWTTYRAIQRADLIIIFDAVLFDRSLLNPLFNFMAPLYLMLPRARRKGVKMGMYDVGIGPVSSDLGKHMLRTLVDQMDFVTVRDEGSIDVLKEAGAYKDEVILAADAAVNAPFSSPEEVARQFKEHDIDYDREFIAININPYLASWADTKSAGLDKSTFLTAYAAALRDVWAKTKVPYLFVCTQHMDVDITTELQDRLEPEMTIGRFSNRYCGHQDIKGALGRASLTIGMRLHSIILAASMCVPVVGLAYQPKVKYFLESNGLDDYCLHFDDFSADSLSSIILRAWQNRDQTRSHLERRVPELQAAARIPAGLAQQLLEPSGS
jgi:polysaccharide pyruvyl transferase WcaK-like protein